ncbi:MAG TPA: hypothetical protein PKE69_10835 [Pyrinomonadaceae bacterium]|nr:hypothetical protein [Pyrinomonadaceae bacterium]
MKKYGDFIESEKFFAKRLASIVISDSPPSNSSGKPKTNATASKFSI